MKKKILILNNGTLGLCGFRRELIEEICKRYDVKAAASDTGKLDQLQEMGCGFIPLEMEQRGKNLLKELRLCSRIRKLLQEQKPDVVLSYTIKPNIYGGMACASEGVPYIANITGLGTAVENGGLLRAVTVPLYRKGLRKARMVFFQNKTNMEYMVSRKIVTGPYDLLPGSGVNLERFKLLPYPDGDTVDFSFISRIRKEKGIDQFIDAAKAIKKQHPEARFHVYGPCGETYRQKLDELQKMGVLQYHGYAKDVTEVHRGSSCTIHPSYYPEGMSNVLLESAACGRPVITTDRPGCIETVDDGVSGFVIKQRDSADLIEKIEKFLAMSREERRDMGLAGRAKMERDFDRNIVVNKYLDLIEEITRSD